MTETRVTPAEGPLFGLLLQGSEFVNQTCQTFPGLELFQHLM